MSTQVYYFSRTGNSSKTAQELAKKQGVQPRKIDDGKNWGGILGFIKGGYYASSKKSLPAQYIKPDGKDSIVLVMPLWAGAFPPAVRSFINEVGRERITLYVMSKGSKLNDREGFAKIVDAVGNKL